jgi:hypothetical protein
MTTVTTAGLVPAEIRSDDNVIAAANGLPVAGTSSTFRTLLRLPSGMPVQAGDVLDIYADGKVTNDVGRASGETRYVIGVGYHLWYYDASAPSGPIRDATWQIIGRTLGENATLDGHHLVLNIGRMLKVPADWPAGHVMGIAFRAAAMSTAWAVNGGGDVLTVDADGVLIVRKWTVPTPDPDDPRWADYAAAIAALEVRVTALEQPDVPAVG